MTIFDLICGTLGDPVRATPHGIAHQEKRNLPQRLIFDLKTVRMKKKVSMEVVNPLAAGIDATAALLAPGVTL